MTIIDTQKLTLKRYIYIYILNMSKKEKKRLARIEDCKDVKIQGLAEYTEKMKERLFTTVNNSNSNRI